MFLKTLLSAAAALTLGAAAFAQTNTVAITNGELHMTSADGDVVMDGTILIRGGRIVGVGQDLDVPDSAEVIDAGGMPVTPGFFVSMSAIGLNEIGAVREANDQGTDNMALSAALDARDGYNADSSVIDVTRAGGITRAYTTPSAGGTLFGGCGMVISMERGFDAIVEPCAAQVATLGESAAGQTGGSRQGAMATFRRALEDAIAYDDDPEAYAASGAENRLSVEDASALVPAAMGDQLMMISVHGASDIRRVLELVERYDLDVVLVGATEAWRVADELAEAEVPVLINPLANLPQSFERMGATLTAAQKLSDAGVTVAFYDAGIGYTHNARLLPQLAGNAVANGMDYAAAMRAVTLTPAEMFGLGRSLGTLERGKLADVVIWDGDPFEVTSRPSRVFIEGEEKSLENRQSRLEERYKDLSRGDKPFQYRNR
ncbi:amidohydrolase family protein [Parvularcula sp. ZS-1/3]|uniref:Amidohydrolase family protein n=1 Tax=Parvularcula mediterranea TaxID=2732508 RepID=A0A7Y3RKK2_9PROT|nr:amidohydrolase family protein [Parvularcula mediterranea]NNU15779.1 amidohydrolase family protein [Parvularcula mediterranea]